MLNELLYLVSVEQMCEYSPVIRRDTARRCDIVRNDISINATVCLMSSLVQLSARSNPLCTASSSTAATNRGNKYVSDLRECCVSTLLILLFILK